MAATIVPPGGLVLVTGVNGFLGSHIAAALLKLGYKVRGTVRTEEKANWIKEALLRDCPSGSIETSVVPDSTTPGAWDHVVNGVDGIVHVAGDLSFDPDPNKVITPMLNSLKGLLELAAKEPKVKRFVLTSSNRAVYPAIVNKDFPVDASMWNETAVEAAWAPPPYRSDRGWDVYSALKTQTEQELFKFSRERRPHFIVNSVLPCFSVGPLVHPKQPGSTAGMVVSFWNNPSQGARLRDFGASWFVDAEDTALLHVAGLTQQDIQNERLFAFGGPFNFNSWLEVFRQLDQNRPWPATDPQQSLDLSTFDSKREEEILTRFGRDGFTGFAECVRKAVLESHT